jgi:hypothetical protein
MPSLFYHGEEQKKKQSKRRVGGKPETILEVLFVQVLQNVLVANKRYLQLKIFHECIFFFKFLLKHYNSIILIFQLGVF